MTTDRRALAFALAALAMIDTPRPAAAADPLVFATAFAPGEQGCIHAYEFGAEDSKLKPLRRTAGAENPFFLALSPDRKYLYSIHAKQFSGAAGVVQPGGDHWPRADSMLCAGGIATGRVVGATDRRGEDGVERRVGPQDFRATIDQHLGIDYERVTLPDFSGRPVPIVHDGKPIPELMSA